MFGLYYKTGQMPTQKNNTQVMICRIYKCENDVCEFWRPKTVTYQATLAIKTNVSDKVEQNQSKHSESDSTKKSQIVSALLGKSLRGAEASIRKHCYSNRQLYTRLHQV
jgi:hypothetical protein